MVFVSLTKRFVSSRWFCFSLFFRTKNFPDNPKGKNIFGREWKKNVSSKMFILMCCHMCVWAGKLGYDTLAERFISFQTMKMFLYLRTWCDSNYFLFLDLFSTFLIFDFAENIFGRGRREFPAVCEICCKQTRAVWQIELKALTSSIHHTLNFTHSSCRIRFDAS